MRLLDRIKSNEEPETAEDKHQDKKAEIGESRVIIRDKKEHAEEVFGEGDFSRYEGDIEIVVQTYRSVASYRDGSKDYAWVDGNTIFDGDKEEWDKLSDMVEEFCDSEKESVIRDLSVL